MERTLVKDLPRHLKEEVLIKGWVEPIRELSTVTFLILRDRTGRVQVAADPGLFAQSRISTESVVEMRGTVTPEPRAKAGYEVIAERITVLAHAENLPISINGPDLQVPPDLILDNRVLSLRHARINPIFKIQAALVHGFQTFLNQGGLCIPCLKRGA